MAKTFTSTTIVGRNRNWTIEIDTPGTGSATIDIEGDIKLAYGAPGMPDFGDWVLASNLRLRIKDTATNELWTGLLAATSDWDTDVRIYSSEATPTYEWHGVVNVGSALRPKFSDIRQNVIDLYVYDGIEGTGDVTLAETTSTFKAKEGVLQVIAAALIIARNGTWSVGGNALNLDAVFDIAPDTSTGDWADDVEIKDYLAFQGATEESFSQLERSIRGAGALRSRPGFGNLSWRAVLNEVATVFCLRVYQQFWNYDTVATFPRWNAVHPNATGTNVTQANNGSISVAAADNDEAAAPAGGIGEDSSGDTQLAATQDADLTFSKLPTVKRVEYEVDIGYSDHAATVVSRDPRPSALEESWLTTTGTPVIDATPANGTAYAHIVLDHLEAVTCYGPRVAQGWGLGLNCKVSLKGNTTTGDPVNNNNVTTVTIRNRDGGTGGGSTTFSFAGIAASQESLTGNFTLTEFSQDGQIEIEIDYDDQGDSLDVEISDIFVEIRNEATSDPMMSWTAPVDSATATKGTTIKIPTRITSVGYKADTPGDEPVYITNSAQADIISYWEIEATGTKYYDVLHACGAFLLGMRDAAPDMIIGKVDGIFPPERSLRTENADGGTSDFYVGAGVEIDLVAETTYGTWIENTNKR